jgi:hypothetical protein
MTSGESELSETPQQLIHRRRIGGWLVIPIFLIVFNSALSAAVVLIIWGSAKFRAEHWFQAYLYMAVGVILILIGVRCLGSIVQRDYRTKHEMVVYFAFDLFSNILRGLTKFYYFFELNHSRIYITSGPAQMFSFLMACIWITYILRSQRVAETFPQPGEGAVTKLADTFS